MTVATNEELMQRSIGKFPIIMVPVEHLREDPKNPNLMTGEELDTLGVAMREFGYLLPILVQGPLTAQDEAEDALVDASGVGIYGIIDGHQRKKGAIRAGLFELPCVLWDGTEEMRRALQLAMNRLRGEMDLTKVSQTLSELEATMGRDQLTLTGYTPDEIERLLKSVELAAQDGDGVMEPTTPPTSTGEEEPAVARPFLLELTFKSSEDLKAAKRALRKAAGGRGHELSDGLLAMIGTKDST